MMRCPMYALKVEDAPEAQDRITVVEREERKEALDHPPKNPMELFQRFVAEATAAKE